jgi:hypothetical protein
MNESVKLVVDQIIKDLQNRAKDFVCTEHVIFDTKTKYSYWISNTFADARIYTPYKLRFGLIHGYRFHSALKKWKAWKMLKESKEVIQ